MSERLKSVLFAAGLCVVCSLLLTAAATGLKGFQERNIAIDRQRNILKAVGLAPVDRRLSPDAVTALYKEVISRVWVDAEGGITAGEKPGAAVMPLFLYWANERIEGYVVPIDSRGLWGRILGYMALKADGSTIAGFAVYKHSETPGLGGEIEKNWFQQNFAGKRIVDSRGEFVSIAIAKGSVEETVSAGLQPHYVDGISGATLTGNFLSAGLKKTLLEYEPVSIRFRTKQVKIRPADLSDLGGWRPRLSKTAVYGRKHKEPFG